MTDYLLNLAIALGFGAAVTLPLVLGELAWNAVAEIREAHARRRAWQDFLRDRPSYRTITQNEALRGDNHA